VTSATETAAYEVDGDRVHPTDHAQGPWFAEQQHGAAVLALLARFLERVPSAGPMRFTRIIADLSRAVPMTEMSVTARARRDGRRVQSLEAEIVAGDEVVARAVATRIRFEPGLVPADLVPAPPAADAPPPLDGVPITFDTGYVSFHDCLEIRARDSVGDHDTWYRLARPVVAGETPSPAVRMAAIADMIIGPGRRLGAGWTALNPEVMLQVEREPDGEWLCNTSTVRFGDDGIAVCSGVMYDRRGRVGCSSKSVLIDRR
jgi:acyl-coenzyme A thioesterase PaaI-like protein